jgi:hypothetical protein
MLKRCVAFAGCSAPASLFYNERTPREVKVEANKDIQAFMTNMFFGQTLSTLLLNFSYFRLLSI